MKGKLHKQMKWCMKSIPESSFESVHCKFVREKVVLPRIACDCPPFAPEHSRSAVDSFLHPDPSARSVSLVFQMQQTPDCSERYLLTAGKLHWRINRLVGPVKDNKAIKYHLTRV